jgi:hypothetical protein
VDETETPANDTTRSPSDDHDDLGQVDDLTLAALLRQAARLRAIELQLDAVFDVRSHTRAMRHAADVDSRASGRSDTG